jgi:hypothetical protein
MLSVRLITLLMVSSCRPSQMISRVSTSEQTVGCAQAFDLAGMTNPGGWAGGWPTFSDLLRAPFPLRVPHSCVFCQGGRRCCVCYLILLWTRDQTHLAPAFPTPALRRNAKEPGTRCVGNAAGRYNWSAGQPRAAVPTKPARSKARDPAGALHWHERNSCPSRSLPREQQCRG